MRKKLPGDRWFRRIARVTALAILCLSLGECGALAAAETGQYLTADDLRALAPAYEAFLQQLADVIIQRGLISPEEREDWLLYQLGDYYQNGGSGMIAAMFSPGLLAEVRPQDSLLRLQKEFPLGTLRVDTMGAYSPLDGSMPGLLLEASLTDKEGLPVLCRFRWSCDQGGFSTWDALSGKVVDVGVEYINDGRPAYWSDQPITGDASGMLWNIRLEILSLNDDSRVLGNASLLLTPAGSGWELDETSLR